MRKIALNLLAASLIAGSTAAGAAAAAERHHIRKVDRAASEQFRNANNAAASPVAQPGWYSDYSEGHVISAPAGR